MNCFSGRINELRALMEQDEIDAYIVLTDDFHASEYANEYFKCREYLSGFTGSAGTLLVMRDEALLWTDGRYFIQAESELRGSGILLMKMGEKNCPTLAEYLRDKLAKNMTVGFDGRTVNCSYFDNLSKLLADKNINFKTEKDLVNEIWKNRPAFPATDIFDLDIKYAGEARESKLTRVRACIKEQGAEAFLLSALDEICWLFNIRGGDISYCPLVMSYALIYMDRAVLYIAKEKMPEELIRALEKNEVELKSYFEIYEDVKALKTSIFIDKNTINFTLFNSIKDAKVITGISPIVLFKAMKNSIEMENIRKAHIIDGVAVTRHLYWLKHTEEDLTELSVAAKLLEFRKQGEGFIEESFAPIIATGYHGAIVHYDPTEETNIPIINNTFLLMDTGGHYFSGTTDITRTISVGTVTEEMKRHYTVVLCGNLRLANTKFRYGMTGSQLDVIARQKLWDMELDYNHGTGHGVGYLLNVHEGPQNISSRRAGGHAFEEGMLTSDEPGLYLENQYGIRLENLMLCHEVSENEYGSFMKFETVTLCPFDKDAILIEALSEEDKNLLNDYHEMVYEKISKYLNPDEKKWLRDVTSPIV